MRMTGSAAKRFEEISKLMKTVYNLYFDKEAMGYVINALVKTH